MRRLTKRQREFLGWLASQPRGVVDITDERIARPLVDLGYVFKFFETTGENLSPVWTITDAGRLALREQDDV